MIAEIRLFAGPYAPRGWHFCDGTLLQVNSNRSLFDLIGYRFAGNGTVFLLYRICGEELLLVPYPNTRAKGI